MKIRTNSEFKLLGTSAVFPKGTYRAIPATNQPGWLAAGKVFIHNADGTDLLLDSGDYEVIPETEQELVKLASSTQ